MQILRLKLNLTFFQADVYSLGIILLELFLPFKTAMERHSMLRELRSSSLPETVIGKWPDMVIRLFLIFL